MPTLPFPLFSRSYKNADGVVLSDDSARQLNGFLDSKLGINIRPGEVLATNTNKRCDGMFFWSDKNYVVCVEEGIATLRATNGETLENVSAGSAVTFPSSSLVTFASDGTRVYMAGGGKINHINDSGVVTEMVDADAPTAVTHVVWVDGYVLGINGIDGKVYFSVAADGTNWSALGFASAEGEPDNTISLKVVQRQVYLLGTTSTELWENDGVTPFSRISGGLIQIGCAAKYSPIQRGNSLIWLSHTRQFVEFTGTSVKFLPNTYDKELSENFTTVSDCIGNLITKAGKEFLVFQFPTEGRTLVYDPELEDWSEWGAWNADTIKFDAYDIRASIYDLNNAKTFIGKSTAKLIACSSLNSRDDLILGGGTNRFRFYRLTGHIDNGTLKKKRLQELRFRARRGYAAQGVAAADISLRYRNDNGAWSDEREIDLGRVGEYEIPIIMKSLGMYRTRQWEISCTGDVPFTLSGAEGDVTYV